VVTSKRQRHPGHSPGPRYEEHLGTAILLLLFVGYVHVVVRRSWRTGVGWRAYQREETIASR